jgi:hypothetical protein
VSINEVPLLIAELYKITMRLEEIFIGRRFTPDGVLVGSIGEVVAAYIYGLHLTPASTAQCDARTADGRSVQIKLTGKSGTRYGFRWSNIDPPSPPDLLIGLKLTDNGFVEIYNGLFPKDLLDGRPDCKNGQLSVTLSKLKNPKLLDEINSLSEFNKLFISKVDIE